MESDPIVIINRVSVPNHPDVEPALISNQWPMSVPAVAHVTAEGLQFDRAVTFLVGENGTGKSTLLEGIAEAYGLDVRGGHRRKYDPGHSRGVLGQRMRLERTATGSRMLGQKAKGFFLRAETAHDTFTAMAGWPGYGDRHPDEVSHGESVLQVLDGKFTEVGLYLLDEPEDGLSFTSCLRLMAQIALLVDQGAQIICATHSPLLPAFPDAAIFEVGSHGLRSVEWKELEMVDHWARFLANPQAYLRNLLD